MGSSPIIWKTARFILPFLLFLPFILTWSSPVLASSKVPIKFDSFHGYSGTVDYLKAVSRAYPNLTELIEIGRSSLGRPIYVLVLTNMKTGVALDTLIPLRNSRNEVKNVPPMKRHQGKPGQWICGATHGNEFTGTEVCLYIIDKLLTGYENDLEIRRLLDEKVFYICPIVNPDGVYNSVEAGLSQRGNVMLRDDDGDGRINEDGPDDLNRDGFITQFRYKDPKGEFVIDEVDSRLMVRLQPGEKTNKERYSVILEDIDNDKDGKRGEDPASGIDLNRNFPEGWFRADGFPGGQGDYPTSAPEVQALAEFFTNYRNILMAQFFHTSGGFTYRPMGSSPDTAVHRKDAAVYDFILGKKYLEIIGEPIPEAWQQPEEMEKFKAALRGRTRNRYALERGYEFPRGWRVSYNENEDRPYGYGLQADWIYRQYGAYSVTTELWNPLKDIPGFPELKEDTPRSEIQRALLRYQDEKYGGKLFLSWKKFRHPELGEGEIGGWLPAYSGNNAYPGEPLLNVCEKHWQFELFRAKLLPEIVISEVKTKFLYQADSSLSATVNQEIDQAIIKKGQPKGKYSIVEIKAIIENKGELPTHVARGASLALNREDIVWLLGDRDKIKFLIGSPWQRLGVLEGQLKIPVGLAQEESTSRESLSSGQPTLSSQIRLRSETQPTESQTVKILSPSAREVTWVISIEGQTTLKIVASSQKGGTKVKEVILE
ncbi:MAG: M14 family metallopeptidase [Candidatus Aminicenantes bacterium]|nr:M14 family metallopeptidase [Candidatus Aminicenantes bacterium]